MPSLATAATALRRDTFAGALLLAATMLALLWANGPWSGAYFRLRDTTLGPVSLHLDLTLAAWAGEGLLAVFFFVAGLELKRELVCGALRDRRTAVVPFAAAVGGVCVPALVYVAIVTATGARALEGWAIPSATDIAFVLAVLAVAGRGLPPALRAFLLTVAVVDDLLAITIIALAYTADLDGVALAAALVPLAAFVVLVQRRVTAPWLLLPLALATWGLVHASGVHATVAGVALGLAVPAHDLAGRFAHTWSVWSAGFAVPAFALLAAGVDLGQGGGPGELLTSGIALAIVAGLLLGKPLGITGAAWLASRVLGARLDPALGWGDVVAAGCLGGIGFTVSLLVGELAFGPGSAQDQAVRLGVLAGSTAAATAGAVLLRRRAYRGATRPRTARSGGAA